MVHLNAYASADDPDIAAAMRHHLSRIYRYVIHLLERDGNPNAYEEAGGFISRGFLINAAMAIGLESALTPEEWAGDLWQESHRAHRGPARARRRVSPLFFTQIVSNRSQRKETG